MAQIDAKEFIALAEASNNVLFWDCETTGRDADYSSLLVVSCKPYGKKAVSFAVEQPGNDQRVAREAGEFISRFPIWVTYYGKGFDVPFLNTRLLRWGKQPLTRRHHLDMYYLLKYKLATGRRSQAHLLEFLQTKRRKMTLDPDAWNAVVADPKENMATMIARCESDCAGLEELYQRTKHLVIEITK